MIESNNITKKTKYMKIKKSVVSGFLILFIAGLFLSSGLQISDSYNRYAGIALIIISIIIYICGVNDSVNDSIKLETRLDDFEERIKKLEKQK